MGKEKSYFDKAVDELEKELDGKDLRKEWSTNKASLKKKYTLSTSELHRAFGIIGRKQTGKVAKVKVVKEAPKNKGEWQKLYEETFGVKPDNKLTVALLKEAIKNGPPDASLAKDEGVGLPPPPKQDPPGQ